MVIYVCVIIPLVPEKYVLRGYMAMQQPEQKLDKPHVKGKQRKNPPQRTLLIITVILIALTLAIIWILSSLQIVPPSSAPFSQSLEQYLSTLFTFLQPPP